MTKEKIYENLKKLDMAEVRLYLIIRNHMQKNFYGVSKDTILNSSNDDKEKVTELLDKLIEKGYVEIVDNLVCIKNYARRITNKDIKKYNFKNSSCFMFPKMLFTGRKYPNMSNDAKVAYVFCLGFLDTIAKKGDLNSKGEIFIRFTGHVVNIFKTALGIDASRMGEVVRELETNGLVDVEIDEEKKDIKIYIHFIP